MSCSVVPLRLVLMRREVGFDPSRPTFALTGYMRSGNSWTRHLLQARYQHLLRPRCALCSPCAQRATGVLSGSIYNDAPLQQTGLWGEVRAAPVTRLYVTAHALGPGSDQRHDRREDSSRQRHSLHVHRLAALPSGAQLLSSLSPFTLGIPTRRTSRYMSLVYIATTPPSQRSPASLTGPRTGRSDQVL